MPTIPDIHTHRSAITFTVFTVNSRKTTLIIEWNLFDTLSHMASFFNSLVWTDRPRKFDPIDTTRQHVSGAVGRHHCFGRTAYPGIPVRWALPPSAPHNFRTSHAFSPPHPLPTAPAPLCPQEDSQHLPLQLCVSASERRFIRENCDEKTHQCLARSFTYAHSRGAEVCYQRNTYRSDMLLMQNCVLQGSAVRFLFNFDLCFWAETFLQSGYALHACTCVSLLGFCVDTANAYCVFMRNFSVSSNFGCASSAFIRILRVSSKFRQPIFNHFVEQAVKHSIHWLDGIRTPFLAVGAQPHKVLTAHACDSVYTLHYVHTAEREF